MKKLIPDTEEMDTSRPSEDRTHRFETDALLRRHGWRIYARPKRGGAHWSRDGATLSFGEILLTIPEGEVTRAKKLESLYFSEN